MRREFFVYLHELMKKDKRIVAITGDLGYGGFDKIREDFPTRFHNVGAAEQFMLDFATGMALEGKIPVVYSITPFLLFRGFETIRTYINHENIPVILIGSGRDDDYKHDGFSHYAGDDSYFLGGFGNLYCHWPTDTEDMKEIVNEAIKGKRPFYINLKR